jgi:magnesium-transporting ATPase (P-type)
MVWDFPPIYHASFVTNCFLFLLGLLVNLSLFLGYSSLVGILLLCHVMLFYYWYKTSLRYDESFEELELRLFHRKFLNNTNSPFFIFFILTTLCILVASGLFLSASRLNPSLFYTSIAAASLVYALLSACYGFIIRKAVNGVLD